MLASELIERLQTLIDSYGDHDVIITEYNTLRHGYESEDVTDVYLTDLIKHKVFLIE